MLTKTPERPRALPSVNLHSLSVPTAAVKRKDDLIPKTMRYLLSHPEASPTQVAFEACRQGDSYIFEVIIDKTPSDLYEKAIKSQLELHALTEFAEKRSRTKRIKELQANILEKFWMNHGIDVTKYHNHMALKEEFNTKLFDLFYKLRLENRAMLASAEEYVVNGKVIKLDKLQRVNLHKEFTKALTAEFNELEISFSGQKDLDYAFGIYESLRKDITDISYELVKLETAKKQLAAVVKRSTDEIRKHHTAQSNANYDLIGSIDSRLMVRALSAAEQATLLRFIEKPRIQLYAVDPQTGDTFLHTALSSGQFAFAQHLIKKGINLFTVNKSKVIAINAQDSKGNTLLHDLAILGDFEEVCDLILKGANFNIHNSQQETVLDLVTTDSLLSFLFKRLKGERNTKKYLTVLNMIFDHVKIEHFLYNNDTKRPYEIFFQLPEDIKKHIVQQIKDRNFYREFRSPFQADINLAMWKHFCSIEQKPGNGLQRFLSLTSKQSIHQEFEFLDQLQKKLTFAYHLRSDLELHAFLASKQHQKVLEKNTLKLYQTYVNRFFEEQSRLQHTVVPANSRYFIDKQVQYIGTFFFDKAFRPHSIPPQNNLPIAASPICLPPSPARRENPHVTKLKQQYADLARQGRFFFTVASTTKTRLNIDPLGWFPEDKLTSKKP